MTKKFEFKETSRIRGIDAQTAGDELERIRCRDGQIQAKTVVEEAKPETAPLHPVFEWRDEVAAGQYREWQARQLVRSIRVIPADNPKGVAAPAYVNIKPVTRGPGHYQATEVVVQDIDLYSQAMESALSKLRQAERAVRDLEQAAQRTDKKDRLTQIGMALRTLTAVERALTELH